jgi:hypothetical protein
MLRHLPGIVATTTYHVWHLPKFIKAATFSCVAAPFIAATAKKNGLLVRVARCPAPMAFLRHVWLKLPYVMVGLYMLPKCSAYALL